MKDITVRDVLGLVPMGRSVLVERDAIGGVDLGGAPAYCVCSDVQAVLRSGAPYLDYPVGEDSLEVSSGGCIRVVAHPTPAQVEAIRAASSAR